MSALELEIEIWKLRRQLDKGLISTRQFLREAAKLENECHETKID